MCGRYLFMSPLEAVQQMFKFDQMTNLGPNYNVAPTHEMPIGRWRHIPHWAKDEKSLTAR